MNKLNIKLAGLERGYKGKIAVKFECYGSGLSAGYVVAECTSAPVFRSYGAAIKGARRALAAVAATGKFPNMCKFF